MTQNELAKLDFEEYEHNEYEGYLYVLEENKRLKKALDNLRSNMTW